MPRNPRRRSGPEARSAPRRPRGDPGRASSGPIPTRRRQSRPRASSARPLPRSEVGEPRGAAPHPWADDVTSAAPGRLQPAARARLEGPVLPAELPLEVGLLVVYHEAAEREPHGRKRREDPRRVRDERDPRHPGREADVHRVAGDAVGPPRHEAAHGVVRVWRRPRPQERRERPPPEGEAEEGEPRAREAEGFLEGRRDEADRDEPLQEEARREADSEEDRRYHRDVRVVFGRRSSSGSREQGRRLPLLVEKVPDREDGVAEEHARTREAHDLVHLLAHIPRVAVDRALLARGLLLAVRALEEPVARVLEQLLAPRAQLSMARADVERVGLAPNVEHRLDRALLAAETRCGEEEGLVILWNGAHGRFRPRSRCSIRISGPSSPTLIRMRPGVMPRARRSDSGTTACVIVAGCSTYVMAPPRLTASSIGTSLRAR